MALDVFSQGGLISTQVLNEFIQVASRNRQRSWQEIEAAVTVIRMHFQDTVPTTADAHAAALALARDHSLSPYNALIVASALETGCNALYSEDMQDGRCFAGLAIINPFMP